MPPSKAVAWPREIYNDDEVQSLDDQGQFIICRVCAESYAALGGKTPKPVAMNACFRTRAWETHKRRTRAHRKPRSCDSPRQHSDGSFAVTTFLQRVEADRRDQMHGFNAHHTPLAKIDDVVLSRTPDLLPVPESNSFVDHLSFAEPDDLNPRVMHQKTDFPAGRAINDVARTPLSHQSSNHLQTSASRALLLNQLLNPVDSGEENTFTQRHKAEIHPVTDSEHWAGKRQRTPCEATPGQPSRRFSTHDLYWKTMREVFSCDASAANTKQNDLRRPQHRSEDRPSAVTRGIPRGKQT